jgi:myosin heavy subunit
LNKLEEKRDEKINSFIIKLQTNCRRFLAIKSYNKKKVQHSAVCCLQKNIRIFFALKKWKWWHLHTNLMPILNVQSNETINKQLREELGQMHRKFDRLSNEKNELKVANSQLENKVLKICLYI